MCRWLCYLGKPITPYRFIYEEEYSLVEQSHHARQSKTEVNADGFGFGWYGDYDPEPGRFRDILPAWSDENLLSLARSIRSGIFMVHVRAATDMATSRTNCHPFTCKNNMFVHNGQIGGYMRLRRQIETLIPDELYSYRLGSTDSEALFLYLHSLLAKHNFHNAACKLIETVEAIMQKADIKEPFRFTSAYCDGEQIYIVRYASDGRAPSLSYHWDKEGWIIVSEPLDDEKDRWTTVPRNHTMVINHSLSEPIITAL